MQKLCTSLCTGGFADAAATVSAAACLGPPGGARESLNFTHSGTVKSLCRCPATARPTRADSDRPDQQRAVSKRLAT